MLKSGRLNYIFLLSIILLLVVLFYGAIKDTALICWNDDDYSHGLILPFISGWLIWTKLPELSLSWLSNSRDEKRFSWGGFFLLLIGVCILIIGHVSHLLFASWLAFFPTISGVLILLFGWKVASAFLPPLLLLFMAKPIPDSLVPILFFPLQVFAAKVSAEVLELLHVPVYLLGNIIEIPGMRLMVEEACSGMRSLMALLTVSFIVVLIVPMRLYAKCLIVMLSILVAIIANVFRVAMTGVLAHFYDKQAATGFFHEFSGMIVFIVGLAIVYGLASLFTVKK